MKTSGRKAARSPARSLAEAEAEAWQALLAWRRGKAPAGLAAHAAASKGAAGLVALYGPLLEREIVTVAHLAQSLDGRIACAGGASRWLSGEEDLDHTHRMRALSDAVVVGARTVEHDDPLLTVRRCDGDHPVRVVIDPSRRLAAHHRVFGDETAPTLHVVAEGRAEPGEREGTSELLPLPCIDGCIAPRAILAALAKRGLRRVFVEGGGITISHFLAARALDRLQLTVAPLLLGSGRPSLVLPEIAEPKSGLRPRVRRIALGNDLLFECAFDG